MTTLQDHQAAANSPRARLTIPSPPASPHKACAPGPDHFGGPPLTSYNFFQCLSCSGGAQTAHSTSGFVQCISSLTQFHRFLLLRVLAELWHSATADLCKQVQVPVMVGDKASLPGAVFDHCRSSKPQGPAKSTEHVLLTKETVHCKFWTRFLLEINLAFLTRICPTEQQTKRKKYKADGNPQQKQKEI